MKRIDLSGMRFGRLQVIELGDYYINGAGHKCRKWICLCDCGNTKEALRGDLKMGKVKSCGCLKPESKTITHNLSKTRLYRIWCGMKTRCTNPNSVNYKNYGGRGVSICSDWLNNFESFYEWSVANGYNDELTLDRINNDGNYEPFNCKWPTYKEQSQNKRDVKLYTFNGKTQTQKEWSLELGGNPALIASRLSKGWSLERALSTPVVKRKG